MTPDELIEAIELEFGPDGPVVEAARALRTEVNRLLAVLKIAEDALASCYDVQEWPAEEGSPQLTALHQIRAAFHVPAALPEDK